jgi:hypothetical protein
MHRFAAGALEAAGVIVTGAMVFRSSDRARPGAVRQFTSRIFEA